MQIGSFTISPALFWIMISLVIFFVLAFLRRVTRDGVWELGNTKKTAWTDNATGTSFAGNSVLMPNEVGSRRKKFGKTVWSWPITIVVGAMVLLFLKGIGVI